MPCHTGRPPCRRRSSAASGLCQRGGAAGRRVRARANERTHGDGAAQTAGPAAGGSLQRRPHRTVQLGADSARRLTTRACAGGDARARRGVRHHKAAAEREAAWLRGGARRRALPVRRAQRAGGVGERQGRRVDLVARRVCWRHVPERLPREVSRVVVGVGTPRRRRDRHDEGGLDALDVRVRRRDAGCDPQDPLRPRPEAEGTAHLGRDAKRGAPPARVGRGGLALSRHALRPVQSQPVPGWQ
mmetsp:Transcript_787/g.2285  ORF Transcript_787/g.2285 Transcript_787/m.2285 type:complete len:244 (-) Transcript_787:226-957(-)